MIATRLILKNWRNFRSVDIELQERMFIVGPNASGKSNLLDVFRFLRDISRQKGGGLQNAIDIRGGLSKIRCLAARQDPFVDIEIHLSEPPDCWKYKISIKQDVRGYRQPYVAEEMVLKNEVEILRRPSKEDVNDRKRLIQTHLEQINTNVDFRKIADFFESFTYLHLVPQLLRYSNAFTVTGLEGDPFGRNFLDRIIQTPEKTRKARFNKIEQALRLAVPQLKELKVMHDKMGIPHLETVYEHWRAKGAKQREDQFSDGTLRLLGFLWSLLEGDSLLLLEEPELSLHSAIVKKLPALMYRLQKQRKRQVLVSTHSSDLLQDRGIGGEEVILLTPSKEGTQAAVSSSIKEVRLLLESGMPVSEAVLPRTEPDKVKQLELFTS